MKLDEYKREFVKIGSKISETVNKVYITNSWNNFLLNYFVNLEKSHVKFERTGATSPQTDAPTTPYPTTEPSTMAPSTYPPTGGETNDPPTFQTVNPTDFDSSPDPSTIGPSTPPSDPITTPTDPTSCCERKGVIRKCLGVCMACTDTSLETYNLVSRNNRCHKYEKPAKECCDQLYSNESKETDLLK